MTKDIKQIQEFVRLNALGKNLTLAVILDTLHHRGRDYNGCYGINQNHYDFETWWITSSGGAIGIIDQWHCEWDLLKPFQKQKPETQLAIAKLLGYKNNF